jgi:hypothetical protein
VTYLDEMADAIRLNVPPQALPQGDVDALFRVYAVLALAKGDRATREDVHNAWVAWMLDRGESHESIRPFQELDERTKEEDSPFVRAIHLAALALRGRGS